MLKEYRILAIACLAIFCISIVDLDIALYTNSPEIAKEKPSYKDEYEYKRAFLFRGPIWDVVTPLIRGLGLFVHDSRDEILAISTVFIAIFTCTLWASTSGMYRLGRRQIEIAREEFHATHRPRIILRGAYMLMENDGNPYTVLYTIANVGESNARIVQSAFSMDYGGALSQPILPPVSIGENSIGEIKLAPGQSYNGEHEEKSNMRRPPPNDRRLFFSGHIVYADENSVFREMAFRRVFDQRSWRFIIAVIDREGTNYPEHNQLDYDD